LKARARAGAFVEGAGERHGSPERDFLYVEDAVAAYLATRLVPLYTPAILRP
jgi:nucleoside-diphosphate-sugar epimerase